jgi:hypothetical protein
MSAPHPRRERLAERLRLLRAGRFSSGSEFARHIGWPQPRVSKLETGTQLPTEDDVRAWVRAVDGDSSVEAELLELLAASRVEYVSNRDAAKQPGGLAAAQVGIAAVEAQSTRIAEYQPAMVPGLLQTAAYARELLSPPLVSFANPDAAETEALIKARMRRQDILYQPARRVQVVMGEAALRSAPGTVQTLVDQLDRLVGLADLPSVEISVIPFPVMPTTTVSCFGLYDTEVAWVETLTGEQTLFDPDEVAVYVEAFEHLVGQAASGADAVSLVQRVSAELRALS